MINLRDVWRGVGTFCYCCRQDGEAQGALYLSFRQNVFRKSAPPKALIPGADMLRER